MASISRTEAVHALFAAYLANDRARVEDMFAEDFRFTSPFDDQIDKPTYFERCWRDSSWIERHALEHVVVDGDIAVVTYHCLATSGRSFRNTEVIVFRHDKFGRIDVYFGATYQNGAFVRLSA